MKTLREQISDKCKYFNGIMNTSCEAGINYKDVELPNVKPKKFPCIKNSPFRGGTCDKVEFPSVDEVDKQVLEIIDEGKKSMTAYKLVKNHIDKTGERQGFINCPECGGKLNYTSKSMNNHIWAKCKCGLGWME